jgi:hypothetical protein
MSKPNLMYTNLLVLMLYNISLPKIGFHMNKTNNFNFFQNLFRFYKIESIIISWSTMVLSQEKWSEVIQIVASNNYDDFQRVP